MFEWNKIIEEVVGLSIFFGIAALISRKVREIFVVIFAILLGMVIVPVVK